MFNCLNSSSDSIFGTLTSKAPLLIASDAPIKLMMGLVSLDAKVMAIDVDKNNTFTGEFWSGSTSLKLGLIDGIGNADQILKDKFGEDVVLKKLEKPKSFLAKKLSSSIDNQIDSIANTLEERAQWQKFGL